MNWNFDEHMERKRLDETEARALAQGVQARAERDAREWPQQREPRWARVVALLAVCAIAVIVGVLLYLA